MTDPMKDSADARPQWLRDHYPFEPHYMDCADGRIHYLDEGTGHPIVFLHGNPTWSYLWRDLIADLRGSFRCIAPDHLGCGLSEKPSGGRYNLTAHIERTLELVNRLDLPSFDLVVHDWGGAIGMGVATRMPDRVRRIVVTNTAAFPSSRIPLRIAACRVPVLGPFIIKACNGFAAPAAFMAVTKPLPRDVRRGFLYPYRTMASRVAINAFVQDIPMSPRHPSFSELSSIAAKLSLLADKPMLIFWGERDFCFSPHFRENWQLRFPDATVVVNPEAGHYVLEDTGSGGRGRIAKWLRDE